jgi:hypothetical protein
MRQVWLRVRGTVTQWRDERRSRARRRRAMRDKRYWRAVSPNGVVDLGLCTEREAVSQASNFGRISYVDWEKALVFYGTESPPRGAF